MTHSCVIYPLDSVSVFMGFINTIFIRQQLSHITTAMLRRNSFYKQLQHLFTSYIYLTTISSTPWLPLPVPITIRPYGRLVYFPRHSALILLTNKGSGRETTLYSPLPLECVSQTFCCMDFNFFLSTNSFPINFFLPKNFYQCLFEQLVHFVWLVNEFLVYEKRKKRLTFFFFQL